MVGRKLHASLVVVREVTFCPEKKKRGKHFVVQVDNQAPNSFQRTANKGAKVVKCRQGSPDPSKKFDFEAGKGKIVVMVIGIERCARAFCNK